MKTTEQVKVLDWTQITPLLVKAEEVRLLKQKIDEKGAITTDSKVWYLDRVDWKFSPKNTPFSAFVVKDEDDNEETFDFLSGAFKFFLEIATGSVFGDIEVAEKGFNVTYRYFFKFYGAQKVDYKEILIPQGSACYNAGINSVTAL